MEVTMNPRLTRVFAASFVVVALAAAVVLAAPAPSAKTPLQVTYYFLPG
jgi:hypothetical protein